LLILLRRCQHLKGVKNMRRSVLSFGLAAVVILIWPATALAALTDPLLNTAGNYAVLAGSTITNTGPSWISGSIGLSPLTSVTGFPPGLVSMSKDIGPGSPANQAQIDLCGTASGGCTGGAYGRASLETPCTTVGVNLGGSTLGPGIYCQGTLAITAGQTLTLSGLGIYVFQAASTLITGAGARVTLINGAQPCDIFWAVGSSATIGASTTFVGNILAVASITMVTGATLNGRALARAAVTLDTNRIIQAGGCPGGQTQFFAAPVLGSCPSPCVLPATLGVPGELRGGLPWLLVIGVGAGLGVTALGFSARRRRSSV
jgi:Ice-binding-like